MEEGKEQFYDNVVLLVEDLAALSTRAFVERMLCSRTTKNWAKKSFAEVTGKKRIFKIKETLLVTKML